MKKIIWTSNFKKDYKLAEKRHMPMHLLHNIIQKLVNNETLPIENRDHPLSNNWKGYR